MTIPVPTIEKSPVDQVICCGVAIY
jgi:hypothetical protein